MAEQLPSRVTIPPDVLSRELDGELILLNVNSESYYGLDEVGAQIWKCFEQNESLEEVFHALLQQYDVDDESTLQRDVLDLISKLAELGLLEVE